MLEDDGDSGVVAAEAAERCRRYGESLLIRLCCRCCARRRRRRRRCGKKTRARSLQSSVETLVCHDGGGGRIRRFRSAARVFLWLSKNKFLKDSGSSARLERLFDVVIFMGRLESMELLQSLTCRLLQIPADIFSKMARAQLALWIVPPPHCFSLVRDVLENSTDDGIRHLGGHGFASVCTSGASYAMFSTKLAHRLSEVKHLCALDFDRLAIDDLTGRRQNSAAACYLGEIRVVSLLKIKVANLLAETIYEFSTRVPHTRRSQNRRWRDASQNARRSEPLECEHVDATANFVPFRLFRTSDADFRRKTSSSRVKERTSTSD